jgi:hypothetical protein
LVNGDASVWLLSDAEDGGAWCFLGEGQAFVWSEDGDSCIEAIGVEATARDDGGAAADGHGPPRSRVEDM